MSPEAKGQQDLYSKLNELNALLPTPEVIEKRREIVSMLRYGSACYIDGQMLSKERPAFPSSRGNVRTLQAPSDNPWDDRLK